MTGNMTLAGQLAAHIDATYNAAIEAAKDQLKSDIPQLIAQFLGVPTGDDAIAQHVEKLVEAAGNKPKSPAKSTPPAVKASGIRRGPGRPKGSKNKPKGATVEAAAVKKGPSKATSETPVKRGRGRPKKNPVAVQAAPVKRGRGRPRKEETVSAAPKGGAPAKRRGRPKGSKNKPKEEAAAAPKKQASAPAEGVKRGRGRPRKVPAVNTGTPNGTNKDGVYANLRNQIRKTMSARPQA